MPNIRCHRTESIEAWMGGFMSRLPGTKSMKKPPQIPEIEKPEAQQAKYSKPKILNQNTQNRALSCQLVNH